MCLCVLVDMRNCSTYMGEHDASAFMRLGGDPALR